MSAVEKLLAQGGILVGHYVLSSGQHSDQYVYRQAFTTSPQSVSDVAAEMATHYKGQNVDVVLGPALGGIIIAQWVAYHLGKIEGREIPAIFVEKAEAGGKIFDFTRGYESYVENGKNILVVDDMANSRKSLANTIAVTQAKGGNVIGAIVMLDRNPNGHPDNLIHGVPLKALAQRSIDAFDADNCPLCSNGVPINTDVGHGAKFLASKTP